MAERETKTAMLPSLPSITTTISSILNSPAQPEDREKTPAANDRSLASPLSAYIPTSAVNWFRRPQASKPASKSAGNTPRTPEPTETDMFSSSPKELNGDDISRRGSTDNGSESGKKRKRSPRPKTSYSICHAPPRSGGRHKIQVRARPLLQLHKIESRSRPRPAYELLPSAIFSTRLIKAIAKFSGSKHGLSPNDLAIVRAERYHQHESSPVEEDESRDILALICGVGRGHNASTKVKICLEGGVEWEACQLPTGSYEITTTDDHGLKRTVRWVPKKNSKGVMSPSSVASPIMSPVDSTTPSAEKKFNFSTISANSRRHPIIAHLTNASLEISDTYTFPAPSTSQDNIKPHLERQSSDETTTAAADAETLTTTESLRNLISATAIYVALMEGWTTHGGGARTDTPLHRSSSGKSVSPSKAAAPGSPRAPPRPESLDGDAAPVRRSSSLRQALRSPGLLRRSGTGGEAARPGSSSSSLALDTVGAGMMPIPEADSPVASRRRRADTTSTVIVRGSGDGQWRPEVDGGPAGEDETDDEEEEEKSGDEGEAKAGAGDGAADEKVEKGRDKGVKDDAKKRNFSESTYGASEAGSSGSEGTVEKEKKGAKETVKEQKIKKKGLLSKLLCGMV